MPNVDQMVMLKPGDVEQWCAKHWQAVVEDPDVNPLLYCLNVFNVVIDRPEAHRLIGDDFTPAKANAALAIMAPLCCQLTDDERRQALLMAKRGTQN